MTDPRRTEDVRLRAAVESAPSGLLMVDPDGRIVLVNREVERLFGYPREELLGRHVELIVPEAARDSHVRFREEFLQDPSVRAMGVGRDLHGLRKDGRKVPLEIGLTPVVTSEGMFVLSSIVDISARKRAEEHFRAAVESSPAGMVMVDEKGKILLVNREVERLFGYDREELIGSPISTLVPERFRDRHPGYRKAFLDDPRARAMGAGRDLFGLRKDGTEVPVEIGLNPITTESGMLVLASIVDISRRKQEDAQREKLEARLRQSQKMEAVGRLAGGIAHDFNNILGAIQGYAELLEDGRTSRQDREDLAELLRFVDRGKTLVERIQRFGGRKESVRAPISIGPSVREVVRFLRSSLGPDVEIVARIDDATPRVLADPSGMHQVLMNLGINAAHAMPNGGRIEFDLAPFYLTDSKARARPALNEGMHVLLTVRDTGEGISEALQSQVFEPFFTTKDPGKGTGLGLAIVDGIVREHQGAVELESREGEGTTFRVLLPAVEQEEAEVQEAAGLRMGNGERVLVVDDEPALVAVGVRRLERLGYEPVEAVGGEEALIRFREDPEGFALVLSDYLMPGMNGIVLAQAISAIRTGIPILLLTGYIEDLPEESIAGAGVREIVRKPASLPELAEALARHLTGES